MSKPEPIAEATLYGVPPAPSPDALGERGTTPEPPALGRPSDAFVRAVAIVSLVAAVLGVLVLPGLLGSVAEAQAVWGERVTAMAGYLSFAGLLLLTSTFGYELILRAELGFVRYVLLGLSVIVVGLAAPSISTRLIAIPQALLAIVTGVFAIVAAVAGLRAPHTRAPAFVLAMVGLSGVFRAFGWSAASFGSEGALGIARALSTLAVVAAGLSQLVAVAYYATRGRVQGRVVANLALVLGFFVTYLAARKPAFAGPLGAILAASIARGAPSPEPFFLSPVAHYLLPTGIFLAIVAIVQRNQVATVAAGLALALGSQGRLDVPLPALFCLVSGLLLVRAARDGRAMWSDLITTRAQRRADDGDTAMPPPKNVVVSEPKAPEKTAPAEQHVAVAVPATSEPKVVADKPASEPKVVADKAASQPNVVADNPASEPKVIDDKPASQPNVVADKPASEPKVIDDKPAGEPEVVADKSLSEPKIAPEKSADDKGDTSAK